MKQTTASLAGSERLNTVEADVCSESARITSAFVL